MPSFQDLTTTQLKQALQLRERIESLQQELDALLGGTSSTTKKKVSSTKGRRTMSAATIEKMRAAQQARWAHLKSSSAKSSASAKAAPKKGRMTPEGKAKIAATMKVRRAAKTAVSGAAE